ncbi:AAA family ATPase [Leptolyngbya sp. KIOST-1]|uniref:AAA family ATPase n=1 Tax=Leptolyngbya sp. KIOST-1 TaxID=1229172 RepID=UPI00056B09F3|nr:ATP-binding protein [Leptolyngbya sp. KIOST-1]
MKITSFSFKDNSQDWNIQGIHFEQLNLLVGASGVGKTRILRALDLICDVAKGKKRKLDDVEWAISFSHLNKNYEWKLKTSKSVDEAFSSEPGQAEILSESLVGGESFNEIEILYRNEGESRLKDQNLPKLKRTESAITLLSEEDSIKPVSEAFKRFIFNETPQQAVVTIPFNPENAHVEIDFEGGVSEAEKVKQFKESVVDAPTVFKAYLLQKFLPSLFGEVREAYVDVFPNVKDFRVVVNRDSNNSYILIFEINEGINESWISQQRISSGMYRTLIYLVEIMTAPEESVIVIDEFENSLGINCMPELTDFILERSPRLQFILTSHHPYIINNIPWKTWQVVSRVDGKITSKKAENIPQLDTASSLDKFTQLVDLLEYEDDVA